MIQEQMKNDKKYQNDTGDTEEIPGKSFETATCWARTISGCNTHNGTPIYEFLHASGHIARIYSKGRCNYKISHGKEADNCKYHHYCEHNSLVARTLRPEVDQYDTHAVKGMVQHTGNQSQRYDTYDCQAK